jgi:hypothetical protein
MNFAQLQSDFLVGTLLYALSSLALFVSPFLLSFPLLISIISLSGAGTAQPV